MPAECQQWVQLVANILTIAASGVALYLFFFKSSAVSETIRGLRQFSFFLSHGELVRKLDKLEDEKLGTQSSKEKAYAIFQGVRGQLSQLPAIKRSLSDESTTILTDISADSRNMNTANLNFLINELRELLRMKSSDTIGGSDGRKS